MQVATSTTPIAAPTLTEKAEKNKDGSVLLSVTDDRICKLNGVGALTWMLLEDHPAGVNVESLINELSAQFSAINAEGRLLYDVSRERLWSDTDRFLKQLVEMHLLTRETDSHGHDVYHIRAGVCGTTTSTVAQQSPTAPAALSPESHIRPSRCETLSAFIGLLAFDLLLKIRGFQTLIDKVEHWPTAEPRTTDLETCRRVRAMVDRAQMYYPKKAMCLQQSAVLTCLLRRRGVPAEMVLAAQPFPAKAHAWVEVAGTVINGNQSVRTKYLRLKQV
jgi:hypothetical protein